MADRDSICVGAIGPASPPGIVWAGRDLRDGMDLAADEVNAGGVRGRPLALRFMDTRGTPAAGIAAVDLLQREGAVALVGEFHSVVASAVSRRADELGLPFVCASATLDDITARRSPFVFRLAPPQSYGWSIYADFLARRGCRHVVAVIRRDAYWTGGASVLEGRLAAAGVRFTLVDLPAQPTAVVDAIDALQRERPAPDMLLTLIGYPEPLGSVVRQVRARGLLSRHLSLGDPAGRPVFPDWWATAGDEAAMVPFLAYAVPGGLSSEGRRAARTFEQRFRREPSFIALEGYDSVLAVGQALREAERAEPEAIRAALGRLEVAASRGVIRFSTEAAGVVHQQLEWPPVCVAAFRRAGQRFAEADVLWAPPR